MAGWQTVSTSIVVMIKHPSARFGIVGVDPAEGVTSAGFRVGDGQHTVAGLDLDEGFISKSAPHVGIVDYL